MLATRKQNIRRFGAGWLRPPGIPKTLQGLDDERAEREEAEMMRQREIAMEEARMAQEAMDGPDVEFAEGDPEQERDLDDEVPDMDEEGSWSDEEEEGGDEWDDDDDVIDLDDGEIEGLEGAEGGEGDYGSPVRQPLPPARPTFNPGASGGGRNVFVTPSGSFQTPTVRLPARTPEGPVTPIEFGGGARDLDDDVPEAGGYEQSDTELEDASTDDGWIEQIPTSGQVHTPVQAGSRVVSGAQSRVTSGRQQSGGQGYRTPGNTNSSWIGGSGGFGGAPGAGNMHGGSVFGGSPLASTQLGDRSHVSGGSGRTGMSGRRGTGAGGRRGYGREN